MLVDEYQDTNRAQYRLLQLLAEEHRNLTVVGDDFQSVYRFRGADIRNILEFERDFPDATVVKLEQNYRSTQTILDAANALDRPQREPEGEAPVDRRRHAASRSWSPSSTTSTPRPATSPSEINRLVEEGMPRDQIAVFYRMNAQSRVLEDTLVRFEIPYQVIGGTKFYDRAEIKDAVAYLQLLANPADAVSFVAGRQLAAARDRPADPGADALAREHDSASTSGTCSRDPDAGPGAGLGGGQGGRPLRRVDGRACASGPSAAEPVAELLEAVLHETGYIEALEAERTVEAEGRVENLEELVGVAGEFDANRELEGESAT